MLNGFVEGTSGIGELVALLRCGMEAARQDSHGRGKPVTNDDAMDIIDEIGFTKAIVPVMEAVSAVISYNSDAETDEPSDDPN